MVNKRAVSRWFGACLKKTKDCLRGLVRASRPPITVEPHVEEIVSQDPPIQDYFQTLPTEIICMIFLLSVADSALAHITFSQPLRLAWVCSRWRNIAVKQPQLWTTFIAKPKQRWALCPEILEQWLQRAGEMHPLSISLYAEDYNFHGEHIYDTRQLQYLVACIATICSYSHRWKVIVLSVPQWATNFIRYNTSDTRLLTKFLVNTFRDPMIWQPANHRRNGFPVHPSSIPYLPPHARIAFEELLCGMLSSPKWQPPMINPALIPTNLYLGVYHPTHRIDWDNITTLSYSVYDGPCLDILRKCPHLQCLFLIFKKETTNHPGTVGDPITLPHLTFLRAHYDIPGTLGCLLDRLTTPSLIDLHIHEDVYVRRVLIVAKLTVLLERSRAHITHLSLDVVSINYGDLYQLLRVSPSMQYFSFKIRFGEHMPRLRRRPGGSISYHPHFSISPKNGHLLV